MVFTGAQNGAQWTQGVPQHAVLRTPIAGLTATEILLRNGVQGDWIERELAGGARQSAQERPLGFEVVRYIR